MQFDHRLHTSFEAIAVVMLLLLGTCAFALCFQQSEQTLKAGDVPTVSFTPHLGTFHYEISWGALPVATATIAIQKDGAHYRLKADQQTIGLIDRLYRLHYLGETVVRREDLSPVEVVIHEQKRRERTTLKARYPEGLPIKAVETLTEGKAPPETKTYDIKTEPYVLDMYSAILLVRSLDWRPGKSMHFEVFTGEKRYAVSMECIEKGVFKLNEEEIPAWVIRPHVLKLGDPNAEPRHTKARIYLSADKSRDLLKIKTKLDIGGALVWELVSYRTEQHAKALPPP
jgi:hypothetical protein